METQEQTTQAQDLTVVGAVQPIVERFVVAEPLQGERAERVYEEVSKLIKDEFSKTRAFQGCWNYNARTGQIEGSSIFHLILANDAKILGSMGLRTPTYEEGRMLDSQQKLSEKVYRDFEIVGYDAGNPNADIAELIMNSAKGRVGFPFKAHPRALKLGNADTKYNVGIFFTDDLSGVVSGERAKRTIDSCDYKEGSGVRRLGRDRGGNWNANRDADWDYLAGSGDDGLVDWVCREATRAEIEALDAKVIEGHYQANLNNAVRDLQSQRDRAFAVLRGKE